MRLALAVSLLAVALAAPAVSAQTVDSFRQLPLRINRDDNVRVVEQSGANVTGEAVQRTARAGARCLRPFSGARRSAP